LTDDVTTAGAELIRAMAAGDRQAFAQLYDRIRARRRRGETFVAPVDESLAAAPADPAGDPAQRAEERGVLRSALERLREVVQPT
jgi:DNA-directed RNA polymerase specialized sigma24 family protein